MAQLFKILDKKEGIIIESHYYNFLKNNKPKDIHSINTKLNYLESLGFTVGFDKLPEEDLFILQCIERTYFDLEIKPLLEKERYIINSI